MPRRRAASIDEMDPGELKRVELGGFAVCLTRAADGNVYAFEDRCSHEGTPLSEGTLEGMEVECYAHLSRFNVTTGEVLSPPAPGPIRTYPVTSEGADIFVELPEDAA